MFVYFCTLKHAFVDIYFELSFCFCIKVATLNFRLDELQQRVLLHLDPSINIYFHKIPFQENPAKTNGVENNGICDPVLTFLSCVSSFFRFLSLLPSSDLCLHGSTSPLLYNNIVPLLSLGRNALFPVAMAT